jgi:type 2 lantibiotic biosynthesis protein LanM
MLSDYGLHPRRLRDGADWSIEREVLKSSATRRESRPASWRTWIEEELSLRRLDIPLFEVAIDGTALGGGAIAPIDDYLTQSGYDAALARVQTLGDWRRAEAHGQCIRLALRQDDRPVSEDRQARPPHDPAARAAIAIADKLRHAAYEPRRGQTTWIGVLGNGRSRERRLDSVAWDLFAGRCGIALAIAAVEGYEKIRAENSFALRVLRPLERFLNAGEPIDDDIPEPVGLAGLGGIVYTLTHVARHQQSEPLLDAAVHAADLMERTRIDADAALDVMSGSAGALLGLATVYAASPRPSILDRAVRCGRRLLSTTDAFRRQRLSDAPTSATIAGFAHGAAGVTYALSRLYRVTGERIYRTAALNTFSHHGTIDDAVSRGMFGDVRPIDAMRKSWCRGAAGIGLARIACAQLLDAPELLEDVDALLLAAAESAADRSVSDQVCCGRMGHVELLLTAGEVLRRSDLTARARQMAAQIIERAMRSGTYSLTAVDDVFSPGYYQGLAGIAYGLLRAHTPTLPSVLLWE